MSHRRHREIPISARREKNNLELETEFYHDVTNEIIRAERAMRTTASFFFRQLISANSSLFFSQFKTSTVHTKQ
ncbi:hypothetical protein HNV12_13690 [Methanococcoides sp. SA1]|nr:hypothetical protein [Methanococcoides sp. SA1]